MRAYRSSILATSLRSAQQVAGVMIALKSVPMVASVDKQRRDWRRLFPGSFDWVDADSNFYTPNHWRQRARTGACVQASEQLRNLLLLRRQNGRTCYAFTGLGIEDLRYLFMVRIVERMLRRARVQFFQSLSDVLPRRHTSTTMFTVRTVNPQQRKKVAS